MTLAFRDEAIMMTDPGEAVLTSAAPQFSEAAIAGRRRRLRCGGRVLRPLNSERDLVVLFGDDNRALVVKFSNEAESATNIDLEEAAALWAVTADPGSRSPPAYSDGADIRHLVVENPNTGRHTSFGLRPSAGSRLPWRRSHSRAVVAYGAAAARTARACAASSTQLRGPSTALACRGTGEDAQVRRAHRRPQTRRLVDAATTASRNESPRDGVRCGHRSCMAISRWTTSSSTKTG